MKLSVIILTHNNQADLKECLGSVAGADEIVVIDDGSADNTVNIARKAGARVFTNQLVSFAEQRNFGIRQAAYPWVLFIDSDEKVAPELMKEIKAVIGSTVNSAFRLKRANHFFGRRVRHGGFWPDWQTRLFKKSDFQRFTGTIHESPHWTGNLGSLSHPLIHYSHKNMEAILTKSAAWTKLEAREFIKAGHPPVTWWRLVKVMVWEFCFRYFKHFGFLDGFIGLVEALVQSMNRFFVYVQIWEIQKNEDRSL